MTELRRWSEEGATASELSLLEISRREQAPSGARARALKALGLVAAASTVATATTAAAATGRSTAALLKLLSIPVVGGGLVAGGLVLEHVQRAHTTEPSRAALIASASALAVTHPPALPLAPVDSAVASASPTAASAAASTPAPTASMGGRSARAEGAAGRLAREVQALELVQQALAAHNASSALHLLDRYGTEFPGGVLGSEATVLRVQALLMSGNRGAAQALADSYSSAHPDSPYAHRIQDTLRSGR
jgi:hypothetical protein